MAPLTTLPRSALRQFRRYATPAARGALFLVAVDALTNGIDYGFHVYLGRALTPGDFAVIQTINSLVLIVLTTFGVLQPVVARFVAEDKAGGRGDLSLAGRAVFQYYFRLAAAAGILFMAVIWLARRPLATWLAVPEPVFTLALPLLLLALLRPVVAGYLQGRERMVAFGLVRTAHAVGRFLAAIALVATAGLLGAMAAFPTGAAFALVAGLFFAGRAVWRSGPPLPSHHVRHGIALAASALFAYAAYMSLLNNDLIWVNRTYTPEFAGNYATAVLLRRVLALAPGAMLVVFYPRAIARMAQGRLPDGLLLKSGVAVAVPSLALIALYFTFGADIVRFAFGSGYDPSNWLLGWLGAGMLGYAFVSLWMNLFLAARPLPFVLMLVIVAIIQAFLYARFDADPAQTVTLFVAGGWALTLGGLGLYLFGLRPSLLASRPLS